MTKENKHHIHLNQQNHITLFPAKEKPKVLICNECKQFWLQLTKECPDCGCKTLTRTHSSNAKYSKDAENSLEKAAIEYSTHLKSMSEFEDVGSGFIEMIYKAGAKWVIENNYKGE